MSLAKLLAKRDKLITDLDEVKKKIADLQATSIDLTRVVTGAVVAFTYGRGDDKRKLQGTVLGRKAQEKGAELVRIQTGDGFDAQTITTFISNIDGIVSSPVPADTGEAPTEGGSAE